MSWPVYLTWFVLLGLLFVCWCWTLTQVSLRQRGRFLSWRKRSRPQKNAPQVEEQPSGHLFPQDYQMMWVPKRPSTHKKNPVD